MGVGGAGQSKGHKESVRLTKFCFFVGIPRFLTITTSQLQVGALRLLPFSHRLGPMGRSRLSRLNMLRMVNNEVELRCLLRMDGSTNTSHKINKIPYGEHEIHERL